MNDGDGPAIIVVRLVGGRYEGILVAVWDFPIMVRYFSDGFDVTVPLVSTGTVEWDGDRPREVYVPADRIDEWAVEHDC